MMYNVFFEPLVFRSSMPTLRQQIDEAIEQRLHQAVSQGAHRCYTGHYTEELESWLSSKFGCHPLLANSGTAALELALRSLGAVSGDEVILAGYDYPGNFWAVEQVGYTPVLVDVQPDSTIMDWNQLDEARSERTRACIVSHLHGQVQPIVELRRWADENGIFLIEDACQSFGGQLEGEEKMALDREVIHDYGKTLGSIGHIGIVSFSGSKVISAGRGGALVTRDDKLFQKAKIASGAGSGAYGMSELAAAVVNAQLPFLQTINENTARFFRELQRAISQDPSARAAVKVLFNELSSEGRGQLAMYQAGWVCSSAEIAALWTGRLDKLNVSGGGGFVGFHRRSKRRCRTVSDLVNTASLVDRLLVIHHGVAMDSQFSSQQLATELAGSIH
jgi:perosamine synthetase